MTEKALSDEHSMECLGGCRMSEFDVNTVWLRNSAATYKSIYSAINNKSSEIQTVAKNIRLSGTCKNTVCNTLASLVQMNGNNANSAKLLYTGLENIARYYEETEGRIKNVQSSENSEPSHTDIENLLRTFLSGDIALAGAVIGGETEVSGTIAGLNASASAEGEILGGSVTQKSRAKWDTEKKDAGIENSIKAEGYLAKGSVSAGLGLASITGTATVGKGSVSGSVGATLYKDGKFTPAAKAEVKGEIAAVEGEAEAKIGSDSTNVHAKASGSVLTAEASAGVSAGVITYKNERTNETTTAVGVQGSVGAEAYVAEGTVSGGFTILGIKIDASVTGSLGGAGGKISGYATTGGVSGTVKAGLGIGAGLTISIDWSNFSLW